MVFLGVIAFCAFLLFVHPYLTYPLSLLLFPFRPVTRDAGEAGPSLTLMFSAYNEERSLPDKLANIRAIKAAHPEVEVLAYCDLSSDGTLALLQSASDVLTVIAATQRTGKATGMVRMAGLARGEVCIFTDANVILEPASIPVLRSYFADPAVGGLAGSLRYTNDDASATARTGGLYWQLEEKIKALESRCGSIMGADGSIFAIRRALYPPVPPHLLDDMTVSMAVPLAGQRLVFAPDVIAFEKNATSSADEFRRKRRIACRAFNTHLYLRPVINRSFGLADRYKYLSHKLLRWFGLVPLAVAIVAGSAAFLAADQHYAFAILVVLAVVTVLLGKARLSPFSVVLEILLAVVATFYGIVDSWRGLTYQTWTPAQSRS